MLKEYGLLMELRHILMDTGKVRKKELLKIFEYKLLILMITQMNINQNIIQNWHIFQIIHTEYLL